MLHSRQEKSTRSDTKVSRKQRAPSPPSHALDAGGGDHVKNKPRRVYPGESETSYASNTRISKSNDPEFQSLKLESMSTLEEYGALSKTLSSVLENDIRSSTQYLDSASGSLIDDNDSDASSSSSGEERDLTQSMFKEQVKFFCQMKDFLMSQQLSLRRQLETLNVRLIKKRKATPGRQLTAASSSNIHIPVSVKADSVPERNEHHNHENLQQFFSCSSTKSDENFHLCPLCGIELEGAENSQALEEHVASHWCSSEPSA